MDPNQKDPNVMTFMMQIIQEKHGDSVDSKFLEEEASRLYDEFGDRLVSYFEPMLTEEQRNQFDELVTQGADQDKLLEFLVGSIDNLEQRILDTLNQFKAEYMNKPAAQNS